MGTQDRVPDRAGDRRRLVSVGAMVGRPKSVGGMMDESQHIWACAATVEKLHGADAPRFIAERIGALAIAGDADGMAMWKAIAVRLDAMRKAGGPLS